MTDFKKAWGQADTQSDVMDASVGEINRVAAWALRGLGMAFAVADRAAPIVGWAEAVEGRALTALRVNTPLLDEGRGPDAWHSQVSEAAWTMDASRRSFLEVGPVAIDVLTLAARTGHIGRVDFVNVMDPVFLSGVLRIAARLRRVGVIALSAESDLTLCGAPVATLHAFPGSHGPVFGEYNMLQSDAIDRAVAACREQLTPSGRAGATFSILSYEPANAPASLVTLSRFDAERKYAHAQSHGISVQRKDLLHLYDVEIRTWAPTSERSRGQALA